MSRGKGQVVLVGLCLVVGSATAWGATITVTTTKNDVGFDLHCSLIEAMENANADAQIHQECAAGDGADVIELGRAQVYVLDVFHNYDNGVNGLPAIVGELTINGNGSMIERSNNAEGFRIFYVPEGSKLVLNDLGIQNGRLDAPMRGGGIYNLGGEVHLNNCAVVGNRADRQCGGILNQGGTMTLVESRVNNNEAAEDGGGVCNWFGNLMMYRSEVDGNQSAGDGGGIYNVGRQFEFGSLFISDSYVTNNRAGGVGAGVYQRTGGPSSEVVVSTTLVRSTVSDNVSESGAGGLQVNGLEIAAITSRLEVRDSVVSGNQGRFGAGIFAWYGAVLTVTGTTVSNNYAIDGSGGGIFVGHHSELRLARSTLVGNRASGSGEFQGNGGGLAVTDSTAEVRISTLSGNRAETRDGGAIWLSSGVGCDGLDTSMNIRGSTIVRNSSPRVGAGIRAGRYYGEAPVELHVLNTILAENTVPIPEDSSADFGNCYFEHSADVVSEGYNVVDGGTCAFRATGDREVDDVMLFDLADNGGPTMTHMPRSGSPVLDTGGSDGKTTCTDQRGYLRGADGDHDGCCLCDTGAVEALSAPRSLPHDGELGGMDVPNVDE